VRKKSIKKSANVSIKVVHMNELIFFATYVTYEWAQIAIAILLLAGKASQEQTL
jgi:hypothetical protein